MCRRPCTAIPTRTGARCDCASPGESPGPSATDDDSVVADATAPSPAEEAAAGTAEATGGATDDGTDDEAADDGETAAATGATDTEGTDEASAGPDPADATGEGPDGDAAAGSAGSAEGDTPAAPVLSEAEVELAAQRELLERIEKRKAEKDGPIPAGTKLSGPAADLLAAVRAVESGEKPGAAFFDSPAPAVPRRTVPAPPPVRERAPESVRAPQGAAPEAVAAVAAVLAAGGAPRAWPPRPPGRSAHRRPTPCARTPGSCSPSPASGRTRRTASHARCWATDADPTTSGAPRPWSAGCWSARRCRATPRWTRPRCGPRSPGGR